MYCITYKRLALRSDAKVQAVAWSKSDNHLGIGGLNGQLKVVKLEDTASQSGKQLAIANSTANAAQSGAATAVAAQPKAHQALALNLDLSGHDGSVQRICWNDAFGKMTTGDDRGTVIVWALRPGPHGAEDKLQFVEEMVNYRPQIAVVGMKWDGAGEKICIVYGDGNVMVGTVQGTRLWSQQIADALVPCWSPDNRRLLIGMSTQGRALLYDEQGVQLLSVKIQVFGDNAVANTSVVDVKWFCRPGGSGSSAAIAAVDTLSGNINNNQPALAICFGTGRVQLMADENDEEPRLFDTRMTITCCEWNPLGDLLCIGGRAAKGRNPGGTVILYSAFGQLLFNFFVAPSDVLSCDFDRTGLKLAIACESTCHIFRIFPLIKFAYFSNMLVYAHTMPDNGNLPDGTLMFYDTLRNRVVARKFTARIVALCAHGDFCCAAQQLSNDDNVQTSLSLMNSQSVPIHSAYTFLEPDFMAMNNSHVVLANRNALFIWQYRSSTLGAGAVFDAAGGGAGGRTKRETYVHIDDKAVSERVSAGASATNMNATKDALPVGDGSLEARAVKYQRIQKPTDDPIRAISVSADRFAVARRTGRVHLYSLPGVILDRIVSESLPLPRLIALNCDSSKAAVISESGELSLLKFEGIKSPEGYERDPLDDRTGCWSLMWAQDDPDMFILCEKNRCYVFRGRHPDEPLALSGYCCQFRDLTVTLFRYHHFFQTPPLRTNPTNSVVAGGSAGAAAAGAGALVEHVEIKALRDTRNLLEKVSIADAIAFVEQQNHKHVRLWRTIAEYCLRVHTPTPDLESARFCYAKMRDYAAIQFIKPLQLIQDANVQKAQIAVWFGDYKTAELLYLQADRKDLVLQMHRKLGNWKSVHYVAKELNMDKYAEEASNELGEQLLARHQYREAAMYLKEAKNYDKLVQAYFFDGRFDEMRKLARELPDNDPQNRSTLAELGRLFMHLGLAEESSTTYVRAGLYDEAVRAACQLCEFDLAREIALKLNVKSIDVQAEKELVLRDLQQLNQSAPPTTTTTQNQNSAGVVQPAAGLDGSATPATQTTTSSRKQIELLWKSAEILRRAGSHLEVAQKLYDIAELERMLLSSHRQQLHHGVSDGIEHSKAPSSDFVASATAAVVGGGGGGGGATTNSAANNLQTLARIKKMYVLAAIALDQHWRSAAKSTAIVAATTAAAAVGTTKQNNSATASKRNSNSNKNADVVGTTLETLLNKDAETAADHMDYKFLDNPWKAAEAYHYFILAQQQLYAGQFNFAMRTAILCREYTDLLNAVDVYALMTLCACLNKDWYVANQAMIRLEDQQQEEEEAALGGAGGQDAAAAAAYRKQVADLARQIFTKHSPSLESATANNTSATSSDEAADRNTANVNPTCINCGSEIPAWYLSCQNPRCATPRFPVCVVTGQLITDRSLWQCWRCKRHAKNDAIASRAFCALCHAEKKVSGQR